MYCSELGKATDIRQGCQSQDGCDEFFSKQNKLPAYRNDIVPRKHIIWVDNIT